MEQQIIRKHSLIELIMEVNKTATDPYSEWKIGIGNSKEMDSERYINVIVFNPNNNPAVLDAYNHFKDLGMVAKPFTGTETKYLYMYKIGGAKLPDDAF